MRTAIFFGLIFVTLAINEDILLGVNGKVAGWVFGVLIGMDIWEFIRGKV